MLGEQPHLRRPLRRTELGFHAETVLEGHFRQRDGDAAIGDIMCGIDQALAGQIGDALLQPRFHVKIQSGRRTPDGPQNLLRILRRAEFLLGMAVG